MMTLRIVRKPTARGTVLEVSGELAGPALSEVEAAYRAAERPVSLELSEVVSADASGVILLRTLESEGATVTGASPYLAMRLAAAGEKRSQ